MNDLISRKKAIESLSQDQDNDYTDLYHDGYVDGKWDAIDIIKSLPSAQPDMSEYSDKLWKAAYERGKAEGRGKRKKGHWIPQDHNMKYGMITTTAYFYPKCSRCGNTDNYTNFCSKCGADMRG